MLYFHHCTLVTPAQLIPQAALLVKDGHIAALGKQEDVPCPPEARAVDAGGSYITPGFIDLQLNGGFGLDFTEDPQAIWQVGAQLPRYGVTAFLPTIITSPAETVRQAQAVMRQGPPAGYRGAHALGLHLEGPFLNPAKRGAHQPSYLRPPDLQLAEDWSAQSGVRLVTLAPELPGALTLIRHLAQRGILVSCGHSLASYAEALAAFDAGARYGTHLFNAMPAIDHRQPGLVTALLTDPRPVVGIIPDGIHLHPAVIRLVWKMTTAQRLNLVSDAMAALGMPPGQYHLGEFEVSVDETSARLADGRLAGSLLALDQAWHNLMRYTGCSLPEALQTVTSVPARLLGLVQEGGQLAPGQPADLVWLSSDFNVAATYIDGELVYGG